MRRSCATLSLVSLLVVYKVYTFEIVLRDGMREMALVQDDCTGRRKRFFFPSRLDVVFTDVWVVH